MKQFKEHINGKFGSCVHIANARDEHRGREVKLYHIPGDFEYVGVADGTDCWIAPVIADPFSAACARQLAKIRAGERIVLEQPVNQARRRTVVRPQMELPLPTPATASRERRRVVLAQPEAVTQPTSRSRHVVRR